MEDMLCAGSIPASHIEPNGHVNDDHEEPLQRSNRGFQPRGPVASKLLSCLLLAAESGNTEILNFWLNGHSDVNEVTSAGQTGLMLAAGKGHLPAVDVLCQHGADLNLVDREGKSALLYAAMHGQEDMVAFLHEHGSDIHIVDKSGSTALIYATLIGNVNLVRYFYDKGCDVDYTDQCGFTALMYAARDGHRSVVKFFCQRGADLDIKDPKGGRSALTLATSKNFPKVVQVLCNYGAKLDDTVKTGMTAMHIAAIQGLTDVVKVLIAAGASLKLKDRSRQIPEDLAKSSGHVEVAEILHNAKKKTRREHSANIHIGFTSYVKIVHAVDDDDFDGNIYQNCLDYLETDADLVPYQNIPVESIDLVCSPGDNPRVVSEDEHCVIYEDCDLIWRSSGVLTSCTQAADIGAATAAASVNSTRTGTTPERDAAGEIQPLCPPLPLSTPPLHPLRRSRDLTGPTAPLKPRNQLWPPPIPVYSPPPYPSRLSNPLGANGTRSTTSSNDQAVIQQCGQLLQQQPHQQKQQQQQQQQQQEEQGSASLPDTPQSKHPLESSADTFPIILQFPSSPRAKTEVPDDTSTKRHRSPQGKTDIPAGTSTKNPPSSKSLRLKTELPDSPSPKNPQSPQPLRAKTERTSLQIPKPSRTNLNATADISTKEPKSSMSRAKKIYHPKHARGRPTAQITKSSTDVAQHGPIYNNAPPVPVRPYRSLQNVQHDDDDVHTAVADVKEAAAAGASPPALPPRVPRVGSDIETDAEAFGATSTTPGLRRPTYRAQYGASVRNGSNNQPSGPPLEPPPPLSPRRRKGYDKIVEPIYETVKKCLADFQREKEQGNYRQYTSCTTQASEKDDHITLIVNVNFCSHHNVRCRTLKVQRSEFMAANHSTLAVCRGCRHGQDCPGDSEDGEMTDDADDCKENTKVKTPYCADNDDGDDDGDDDFKCMNSTKVKRPCCVDRDEDDNSSDNTSVKRHVYGDIDDDQDHTLVKTPTCAGSSYDVFDENDDGFVSETCIKSIDSIGLDDNDNDETIVKN